MADDVIASFMVALGFTVNQSSQATAKKSVADYQRAVEQAEKAVEDAKWAGAKSAEDVAKLTRETNLKLARDALQRAKDEEKLELEKAQKRKQRFKEFESDLTKLAAVATAAAAALAVTVGKVTGSFNHLYYVSGRTGASAANLKALGYAFEQTGSSAEAAVSAVEKFTQAMRTNPGVRSFVLNDLHIDPKLDPALQLQKAVETLNEKNKDNPHVAQLQATGLLGLSVEDYNQLTLQGKEIKRLMAERQAFAKSIGLNDKEGADASQKLSQSIGTVVMMVEALRDKLVVQLAPALEKVVKGFLDWIKANPEKIEHIVKGISDAVIWLAQKIAAMVEWFAGSDGEAFLKRWDNFSARISAIGAGFEAIWAVLKKIDAWLHVSTIYKFIDKLGTAILSGPAAFEKANQGAIGGSGASEIGADGKPAIPGVGAVGDYNPLETGSPGRHQADKRSFWQRHAPKFLGGQDAPGEGEGASDGIHRRGRRGTHRREREIEAGVAGATGVARGNLTEEGRENIASWQSFFQRPKDQGGMGLSAEKADAMVAMMQGESGPNLNPRSYNSNDVNGPSGGTAQWHDVTGRGGRLSKLKRFADEREKPWTDREVQQQFWKHEAETSHRVVFQRIEAAPDGPRALGQGVAGFEVPADITGETRKRMAHYNRLRRDREQSPTASAEHAAPAPVVTPIIVKPPAAPMTPGGFDMSKIGQVSFMRPAGPLGASSVVNNSANRAVSQSITNNTTINGSDNPKEHGRIIESSLGRVHGLALANLQTAVV